MSCKSYERRRNRCKSELYQNWDVVRDLKKDLSLEELQYDIERRGIKCDREVVYVYVVATTEIQNNQILQTGTGPNIQGSLVTLTNCKPGMRCDIRRDIINGINLNGKIWEIYEDGIWIAGLTTKDKKKNPHNKNFLFYLVKVGEYFNSFMDLWNYLQGNYPNALSIKRTNVNNLDSNPLGDVYEPKSGCSNPFNPDCYYPPHVNNPHHCCKKYQSQPRCHVNCNVKNGCWRKDITYSKSCRHPYLLTGDKDLSYVWQIPKIQLDLNCLAQLINQNKAVNRGFIKSQKNLRDYVILELNDFLNCLSENAQSSLRKIQCRR